MAKVAVVRAKTDYSDVESAVRTAVDLVGGLGDIVQAGQRVLLKPNLVEVHDGESGATTDKRVVGALASMVKELGAQAVVGDSPGIRWRGASEHVLRETGVQEYCQARGAKTVGFDSVAAAPRELPQGHVLRQASFAQPALEADVIINLPKLKSHALTVFTGAVKNLFGTLPGGQKTQAHLLGANTERFADLLVDIYQFLNPRFAVMDAVVGIGGTWRLDGDRITPGLIVAGQDGVAVDAISAKLTGFEPLDIPVLRIAQERGVGTADPGQIEVVGDDLSSLTVPRLARTGTWMSRLLFSLANTFYHQENPVVRRDLCSGCGHCEKVCPAGAVWLGEDSKPTFDLDRCIHCFCCHELCPERAITIDRGFLANRVLG